jgi:N-acetylmuramoyl-L-alanine amidase
MGMNYKDIIGYYYTDIQFRDIDEREILKSLNHKKIVIDPGHGGDDCGNCYNGLIEKDINLEIALYLEKMLQSIGGDIILIRNSDCDIPLGERVNIINRERPDFYISIHQNSFLSSGVNGVEAYCYNRDEEAMRLGNIICSEISSAVDVKNRGVRTGDYYLLRECKVNGVIVECMYITGNQDIIKFNRENYMHIAEALLRSVCRFYNIEVM